MRCTDHCPPAAAAAPVAVAAVAVVAAALRLEGAVTKLLPLILWTLVAVTAGSVVVLMRVLRRPGAYRVAVPAQEARAVAATRSRAALPERQPRAILGRPVHVITELPVAQQGARAKGR